MPTGLTTATTCRGLVFGLLGCLAACAVPPAKPPTGQPSSVPSAVVPESPSFTQEGLATWYGKAHHGRKTASGERFDMHAMTAAHRSLPFGSVVRVTNLGNGSTVKVRINDRGPFVRDRIIDLSAAAAAALGIKGEGVVEIRIEKFVSDQPQS